MSNKIIHLTPESVAILTSTREAGIDNLYRVYTRSGGAAFALRHELRGGQGTLVRAGNLPTDLKIAAHQDLGLLGWQPMSAERIQEPRPGVTVFEYEDEAGDGDWNDLVVTIEVRDVLDFSNLDLQRSLLGRL